jgi:oxygen-dependent protoporphyrinogen oxidase
MLMSTQVQALVVGAGISGLATAYALQKANVSTMIVEAAARPGGMIRSVQQDGYLLECGPQSFSGNRALTALCSDLELLDERLLADPKAPRFVLINGALQEVPMNPLGLLTSPLLGGGTKRAILRDLLGKSVAPEPDESVADFTRRKFSERLLDWLVGPFVSGIYAGDPEKLSLRAAFPILHEAEKASGSILRGIFPAIQARAAKRPKRPEGQRERPTLQTFTEGNEMLIKALARNLGERLRCGVEVIGIEHLDADRDERAARFCVTARTGQGQETVQAERLVLAVPTDVAGKLLGGLDAEFEKQLGAVEYAGVAVVSLGYRKKDVSHSLEGFGFLVPRSSGLTDLGTVWNSSLFPGRAPEGEALLTSFVGGATNAGALQQTEAALAEMTHKEIAPLLGIHQEPVFSHVTIWPRALPQYNLGHTARLAKIEELRGKFPGLYFAGNYLNGPAIGTCAEQALKVADEIRASFAN